MLIRKYVDSDYEDVVRLLLGFHETSMKDYGLSFELDNLIDAIKDDKNEITVLEIDSNVVGLLAGTLITYPLQNKKLFQEIVWYVEPKFRKYGPALLRFIESDCVRRNIGAIIMVLMGNSMAEKIDRFYERQGYALLEKHYIKDLNK